MKYKEMMKNYYGEVYNISELLKKNLLLSSFTVAIKFLKSGICARVKLIFIPS